MDLRECFRLSEQGGDGRKWPALFNIANDVMEACHPHPAGSARELQLCVANFCYSWLERQTGFVI
jgi:hypothetical protein